MFRADRNTYTNLVALNQLIVFVHVSVVRSIQCGVAQIIQVVNHNSHFVVDILNDLEWAVEELVFNDFSLI